MADTTIPKLKSVKQLLLQLQFPYVFNPVKIELPSDGWFKTNPATSEPTAPQEPSLRQIHLWDGGAYENLGIEPLYKPDRNMIKL